MSSVIQGEPGYRDGPIHPIDVAICSCHGCGGHLVAGTCIPRGCRRGIPEASRFHRRRFAGWGAGPDSGQCSHADAVHVGEEREVERGRQARSRWAAKEDAAALDKGDEQRMLAVGRGALVHVVSRSYATRRTHSAQHRVLQKPLWSG
jgi:hypothetical protein